MNVLRIDKGFNPAIRLAEFYVYSDTFGFSLSKRRRGRYMWWFYAILSAFFAALTVVFAKIGIEKVNSDLATAIRAVVILITAWLIAFSRGGFGSIHSLTRTNYIFLIL